MCVNGCRPPGAGRGGQARERPRRGGGRGLDRGGDRGDDGRVAAADAAGDLSGDPTRSDERDAGRAVRLRARAVQAAAAKCGRKRAAQARGAAAARRHSGRRGTRRGRDGRWDPGAERRDRVGARRRRARRGANLGLPQTKGGRIEGHRGVQCRGASRDLRRRRPGRAARPTAAARSAGHPDGRARGQADPRARLMDVPLRPSRTGIPGSWPPSAGPRPCCSCPTA